MNNEERKKHKIKFINLLISLKRKRIKLNAMFLLLCLITLIPAGMFIALAILEKTVLSFVFAFIALSISIPAIIEIVKYVYDIADCIKEVRTLKADIERISNGEQALRRY